MLGYLKKFEQFDMLAVGKRWGSTFANRRFDDEYPPFTGLRPRIEEDGVAFDLDPDDPMQTLTGGRFAIGDLSAP